MADPVQILLVLAGIQLSLAMTPGQNSLLVIQNATHGISRGFATVLGIFVSSFCWSTVSMAGLGAIYASEPWLVLVMRVLCGSYLVYLGMRLLVASMRPLKKTEGGRPAPSLRAAFLGGFISNITHPKGVAYWMSIYTATGAHAMPLAWRIAAVVMMPLIGLFWYGTVTLAAGSAAGRKALGRLGLWFDAIAGLVMIGFGAALLIWG